MEYTGSTKRQIVKDSNMSITINYFYDNDFMIIDQIQKTWVLKKLRKMKEKSILCILQTAQSIFFLLRLPERFKSGPINKLNIIIFFFETIVMTNPVILKGGGLGVWKYWVPPIAYHPCVKSTKNISVTRTSG
jgi:hypothetical protein